MAKLSLQTYESFLTTLRNGSFTPPRLLTNIHILPVSQQGGQLTIRLLSPTLTYNLPTNIFVKHDYACVKRDSSISPGAEYFSDGTTTVSASMIRTVCQSIADLSYADTMYDSVLKNTVWRTIYDIRKRQIPCKTTTGEQQLETMSFFCHLCGFLHPYGCISIDHYVPQSVTNHTSFYRIMRHLGFSSSGPKGHFGSQILQGFSSSLHTYTAFTTGKHVVSSSPDPVLGELSGSDYLKAARLNATNHTDTAQYTLSAQGLIIAAVLHRVYGDTLPGACTHNMLNLRPVCSSCNSSKNNAFQKSLP